MNLPRILVEVSTKYSAMYISVRQFGVHWSFTDKSLTLSYDSVLFVLCI